MIKKIFLKEGGGHISEIQQANKTRVREIKEEQVRSDGDKRRQTDLGLAHVGQRLFEMLWRSRGMARGQLARISKHKSRDGGALQYNRRGGD